VLVSIQKYIYFQGLRIAVEITLQIVAYHMFIPKNNLIAEYHDHYVQKLRFFAFNVAYIIGSEQLNNNALNN